MIYTLTVNPSLDKLYFLDKLTVGEYNRGEIIRYDPGGKGINVSRCLNALETESVVLGFFGGKTGEFIVNSLQSQGLEVDPVYIKGESRSNITLIESASGQMTKLNEIGPVIDQDAYFLLEEKIKEKTKPGDIWVLSGSIPRGLSDDFYASIIAVIKGQGGLAFLDTSKKWLLLGFQAKPDLLRINDTEAEMIVGKELKAEQDLYTAIRSIQSTGISVAVISRGREGALFADASSLYSVSAPRVEEKTTVGAGDAMMAMIVYGYIHGWSLERIAAWGVAAGSASVMQEGTSTFTLDQVHSLISEVDAKEISGSILSAQ